jgi:hypothetical protein
LSTESHRSTPTFKEHRNRNQRTKAQKPAVVSQTPNPQSEETCDFKLQKDFSHSTCGICCEFSFFLVMSRWDADEDAVNELLARTIAGAELGVKSQLPHLRPSQSVGRAVAGPGVAKPPPPVSADPPLPSVESLEKRLHDLKDGDRSMPDDGSVQQLQYRLDQLRRGGKEAPSVQDLEAKLAALRGPERSAADLPSVENLAERLQHLTGSAVRVTDRVVIDEPVLTEEEQIAKLIAQVQDDVRLEQRHGAKPTPVDGADGSGQWTDDEKPPDDESSSQSSDDARSRSKRRTKRKPAKRGTNHQQPAADSKCIVS